MKIIQYHEVWSIMTNFGGSIAPHKIYVQRRHLYKMKAYNHMQLLRARERIPIEGSRAHRDQRSPGHTLLWMRRWANTILTGITLRQCRDLRPAVNRQPLFPRGGPEELARFHRRLKNKIPPVHVILQHCASAQTPGL